MIEPRFKASFTGYYGMRNFGDDLFGLICSVAARQYWGSQPRLMGVPLPGVAADYTMPEWYPAKLYGAPGVLARVSRFYSFVRGMMGSDVMILGGGSCSREGYRQPIMAWAQRRGWLGLAAVGISIGPYYSAAAEAYASRFLRGFSYIAVRDRRSYDLAVKLGLGEITHCGRDLAGLLPLLFPSLTQQRTQRDSATGITRIGVALCNYDQSANYPAPDREGLLPGLVAALKQVSAQRSIEVHLFILNGHDVHGDRTLTLALHQRLEAAGIPSSLLAFSGCSPLDTVHAIGDCDAFISARLHGAITAYMQGVPFTIIDYNSKCRDFANDVGLAAAQQITVERQDEAALHAAIETMLAGAALPQLSCADYAQQALGMFRHSPWWKG